MHFWIGVENLAKIERAKVCIDHYTLFVGPNNSGKTFLMQLIQGLGNKIVELLDEDAMELILAEEVEGYSKYLLNKDNIVPFVEYINEKLDLKKELLIKEIFGRAISIGKLYIEVALEEDISYQIDIIGSESLENERVKNLLNPEVLSFKFPPEENENKWKTAALSKVNKKKGKVNFIALVVSLKGRELFLFRSVLRHILEQSSLFLPASRTGLMLLYRDFFANKTDDAVSYRVGENALVEDKERYGGLTRPIYSFLYFLQTYSEDEEVASLYRDELSFFEDKIIEGHVSVSKQGIFSYHAKDDSNIVPMYLASSMVNEVAPLVLALSSRSRYERLIIDEVEASLHPQKQLELARFLNRINNGGVSLVLSTHSDTFVSKLNNLYILSERAQKTGHDEAEKRFHVEKEDLIQPENLFVYEFVFQPNGKSVVKEIVPDSETGFHFDLFTKSSMELYDEALRLGESYAIYG